MCEYTAAVANSEEIIKVVRTSLKVLTGMVGAGAMLLSFSSAASASAGATFNGGSSSVVELAELPVNPQVAEVRDSLTALGVDADTQEALIFKLFVLGQRLDGDTDATPIAEQTWTDAGGVHTRYTYADGSKSETVVQQSSPSPDGGVVTQANPKVENCDHTRRADVNTYKYCDVSVSKPTYKMSFILSYNYRQFGCRIDGIASPASGGAGIDTGNEKVTYVVRNSTEHTGVCRATVTVKQTIGVGGVGFNSTVGIDVKVQSSSNWTNKLKLTSIDQ
jgi:hypothetical protein